MSIEFSRPTLQGFGRKHLLKVIYTMARQWDGENSDALMAINAAVDVANHQFPVGLPTVVSLQSLEFLEVQIERQLKIDVADPDFLVTTKDRPQVGTDLAMPVTLVLENIRSSFNVGSCLRSAEAFHISEVALTGYTPGVENNKTAKAALGTEQWLTVESFENTEEVLRKAKARGSKVYAIETAENSKSLYDCDITFPSVFVVGNERFGLSEQTMQLADEVVHVPLYGRKNSLNVGVCAGVLLYELRRQWTQ